MYIEKTEGYLCQRQDQDSQFLPEPTYFIFQGYIKWYGYFCVFKVLQNMHSFSSKIYVIRVAVKKVSQFSFCTSIVNNFNSQNVFMIVKLIWVPKHQGMVIWIFLCLSTYVKHAQFFRRNLYTLCSSKWNLPVSFFTSIFDIYICW